MLVHPGRGKPGVLCGGRRTVHLADTPAATSGRHFCRRDLRGLSGPDQTLCYYYSCPTSTGKCARLPSASQAGFLTSFLSKRGSKESC